MPTLRQVFQAAKEAGIPLIQDPDNAAKLEGDAPVQALVYSLRSQDGENFVYPGVDVRISNFGQKPVSLQSAATSIAVAIGKGEDSDETIKAQRDEAARYCFGVSFLELAKHLARFGQQKAGACQITCNEPANAIDFVEWLASLWQKHQKERAKDRGART